MKELGIKERGALKKATAPLKQKLVTGMRLIYHFGPFIHGCLEDVSNHDWGEWWPDILRDSMDPQTKGTKDCLHVILIGASRVQSAALISTSGSMRLKHKKRLMKSHQSSYTSQAHLPAHLSISKWDISKLVDLSPKFVSRRHSAWLSPLITNSESQNK